tara:strand:- start:41 stop:610 length:570 start_codon:yes stop_codon:yes gene_type:complete
MPNAILRVGPFANGEDSFLDAPDPVNVVGLGGGTVPVNCASAFPFRANISRLFHGEPYAAEIQLNESGPFLARGINFFQGKSTVLTLSFRYQAAIDFDVNLSYLVDVTADSAGMTVSCIKSMATFPFETLGTNSVSGDDIDTELSDDFVISLPASVLPQFVSFELTCTVLGSPDPVNLDFLSSLILKPN